MMVPSPSLRANFFLKAYDLAYFMPIIELAGAHSRFIPQILYIYNHSQPYNANKKASHFRTGDGCVHPGQRKNMIH